MNQLKKPPAGFSISKAHKTQERLSKSIVQVDALPGKIRLVAGVDVAYFDDQAIGAVVVLDYDSMKIVETKTARVRVKFPYIPTLLSFRELPVALEAIKTLKAKPDVFLVDAHGVAHPYGCGFASHLGLVIDKPTIGVAKSKLVGKPGKIGSTEFLVHDEKTVAAVLAKSESAKPVYVSVGHLISLPTATTIVEHLTGKNRISAPLIAAHKLATEKKREALSTSSRDSERTT